MDLINYMTDLQLHSLYRCMGDVQAYECIQMDIWGFSDVWGHLDVWWVYGHMGDAWMYGVYSCTWVYGPMGAYRCMGGMDV